jgi:hypothetical protein
MAAVWKGPAGRRIGSIRDRVGDRRFLPIVENHETTNFS